jgi:hypothetical protein
LVSRRWLLWDLASRLGCGFFLRERLTLSSCLDLSIQHIELMAHRNIDAQSAEKGCIL